MVLLLGAIFLVFTDIVSGIFLRAEVRRLSPAYGRRMTRVMGVLMLLVGVGTITYPIWAPPPA